MLPELPPLPTASDPPKPDRGWRPGRPGPWGRIETLRIEIEAPREYVRPELCAISPEPWILPGYTRAQAEELLRQARLEPLQLAQLHSILRCEDRRCSLNPSADFRWALSQDSRSFIYSELANYVENSLMVNGFRRREADMQRWLQTSELQPETRRSIERLLWRHNEFLVFSDLASLCPRLPAEQERVNLLKSVSRNWALMVRVLIDPKSDINMIASYWGGGQRLKDIRTLLESLARVPGGTSVDVVHLLPAFARKRLFTYPLPTDPSYDCFWSAANFHAIEPNDQFLEPLRVYQALRTHFIEVNPHEPTFGDVLVLVTERNLALHAMVYIADGIVLTKNGRSYRRPWILARLEDVFDAYPEAPTMSAYRLKDDAPPDLAVPTVGVPASLGRQAGSAAPR